MQLKYLIIGVSLVCSCSSIKYSASGNKQKEKKMVKTASIFLQKSNPDFYNKYCSGQEPKVEARTIQDGKCKGLTIYIVTYSYSEESVKENPILVDYAVKVFIDGEKGNVVTIVTGPEGLGEVVDKEIFDCFTPNILKLY